MVDFQRPNRYLLDLNCSGRSREHEKAVPALGALRLTNTGRIDTAGVGLFLLHAVKDVLCLQALSGSDDRVPQSIEHGGG